MIRRGIGLVLVLVFVLTFEPGDATPINRVLLPAVAALGAWLVVDSLAAVALAIAVLAGIHSEPFAADRVRSVIYPAATVIGASIALTVFGRRFLRRVRETRDARTARREARRGA